MSEQRRPDILEAPARHHRIVARNQETREYTHVTDQRERIPSAHYPIGSGGIRLRMTSDDKLADHTGDAQKQDTAHIDQDEYGPTVLSRHIRKSPHITQSHRRTGCSQDDAEFAPEISPFQFCHLLFLLICLQKYEIIHN